MIKILFDDSLESKRYILKLLDKDINNDGFVFEKDGRPVLDTNGQQITVENFGCVKSGSQIFSKSDILSSFAFYRDQFLNQPAGVGSGDVSGQ